MSDKLLIISFVFPPMPGVGGRRWAKFAKYLHRAGVDVHVLAAENFLDGTSAWGPDIQELDGRITYLPSKYPAALGKVPASIPEKLSYRLALAKVKAKVKGNYYDRSAHWIETVKQKTEELVKSGFNNVLITGGPFHTCAHIPAFFKDRYPDVNVILDFRDPWTTNKTAFGFTSLSAERFQKERQLEQKALGNADFVIAVSQEMLDDFAKSVNEDVNAGKYACIPNGYDPEDIPNDLGSENENLRFVFTGTVYRQSHKAFKLFSDFMNSTDAKVEADIYGDFPVEFNAILPEKDNIRIHSRIPLQQVYREINNSMGCLLFLTEDLGYSLSTKFYEYLAVGKPLIVCSNGGGTGEFVESQGLGVSITCPEDFSKLKDILDGKFTLNTEKRDLLLQQFNVETLSRAVINLLQ